MAVDEQAPCFGRIAAKSQNGLDVPSLRQQNVRVRLDRIMKAEGGAKVRVVCLEGRRLRPLRVENRRNG